MPTDFDVRLEDLARLRPLQGVATDEVAALLPLARGVRFEAGEDLISPGKPNRHAWLILHGRATVTVEADTGSRTVGDVWPGEIVGEAAFFHPEIPHRVRVRAAGRCDAIDVSAELLESARGTPALAAMQRYLLTVMARRIRATNTNIQRVWHEQHTAKPETPDPSTAAADRPPTLGERLAALFRGGSR